MSRFPNAIPLEGSLLVVAAEVVQAPNDKQQLGPMVDKITVLPQDVGRPETLVADSGYFSSANVEACANAGIDLSNVDSGFAALLPLDSDRSAHRIRGSVRAEAGVDVGVVVSDTFGRPWRHGLTDVAIGVAGIAAVIDLRGGTDDRGQPLRVTEVALADEIAAAAELVMGKASAIPVAIVRGLERSWFRDGSVRELIRPAQDDLFR